MLVSACSCPRSPVQLRLNTGVGTRGRVVVCGASRKGSSKNGGGQAGDRLSKVMMGTGLMASGLVCL